LGFLVAACMLALAPARVRAFEAAQGAGHESSQKAEAEPGVPAADGAHGATAAHGEEHAEGTPNPMAIQPSLTLWTVVVFVGLFLVLTRFAWTPLTQALHQREEHLEHCLLQTEKARNESEQLLAEHRRLMAEADDRVKAILDRAQKDAQASAEDIIRQAQAEAEAARDRAARDIATARDQALAEIWTQTANLAVSAAGRVLTKELGPDEHRRLLDLAIQELPTAVDGRGGRPS
jgi:F-type H+-transporting ATPase subunit b